MLSGFLKLETLEIICNVCLSLLVETVSSRLDQETRDRDVTRTMNGVAIKSVVSTLYYYVDVADHQ